MMSVDISKLHNVLRDSTRARILELLNERTSLSYVELQELLQIGHTGKLNYHLKVLGDLLVKDEHTGRYSLGEKGTLAVALLSKFQTVTSVKEARRSLVTRLTFVALIAVVVVLVVALIVVVVPKPTTPTLQVIGVSLHPTTISGDAFATLNFTIRNNDATERHLVHINFDETNSSITVYQGNQSVPTVVGISTGDGSSKSQFLWITLQPSEVSTVSFRVTGTLSRGVSTATYSIPVGFEDENLTSFASETVNLTVY
jgi:hypothetical protein